MLREQGFSTRTRRHAAARSAASVSARPTQLVDRYPIACRPVRDLLVAYLPERQPAIDYTRLVDLAYRLGGCFWSDLEQHHPGIDSLRLPREVAGAWKRRLRTKTTTVIRGGERVEVESERLGYLDMLATVRAFYLDLAEWGLDDPVRWGVWVAPCPISQRTWSGASSCAAARPAWTAAPVNGCPCCPCWSQPSTGGARRPQALLQAGATDPARQAVHRCRKDPDQDRPAHAAADNVWVADPDTGKPRLLNLDEEHAFWAWAVIEVLRHTGIRVEELLELSHHSLIQYRLPSTGELVPLLQIAPSKTDAERLLVVSPELADVLSADHLPRPRRRRNRPAGRARDSHELVWLPPSPLLFQRRSAPRTARSAAAASATARRSRSPTPG